MVLCLTRLLGFYDAGWRTEENIAKASEIIWKSFAKNGKWSLMYIYSVLPLSSAHRSPVHVLDSNQGTEDTMIVEKNDSCPASKSNSEFEHNMSDPTPALRITPCKRTVQELDGGDAVGYSH
jgi:hypothetical protein